jgi:uncharacterized protein with HEPN domain
MTMIDDETRVRHMLSAARRAIDLLRERERSDLDDDDVLALAVVRLLEILGEASRAISADLRAGYPHIPWQQMVGTRNRVIHAYFNVDLDIVWGIVRQELPVLVRDLEEMMAREGWG